MSSMRASLQAALDEVSGGRRSALCHLSGELITPSDLAARISAILVKR
jgi:hypothetical protein